MEEERRFSADVENARIRILDLRAVIASDSITLEDLAMEVKIVEDLLKKGAVAPYELQKARVQYNSLAKKLEENKRLVAQANEDLKQAIERQEQYRKFQPYNPSIENALDTIRKEMKVQEQMIEAVTAQLEALKARESVELKAPFDGVVVPITTQTNEAIALRPGEKIVRRPGEVVRAGDTVVAIAQAQPTEIIAYASERTLGQVRERMSVELVKDRAPAQIARSEVVSISPTVELMPQRLWLNPNVPQWGRPVRIKIPPGLQLFPGEVVGIREM
jgi:multidrug resistance efflux pump